MRKIIALFMATVIALVLAIGIGEPAQAAPGCPETYLCLHDTALQNPAYTFQQGIPRYQCQVVYPLTSFETNNTPVLWFGFHTANCTGSHITFSPNVGMAMMSTWNNNINSVYRTPLLSARTDLLAVL